MAQLNIVLDAGHALTTAGKQTPDGIKEWSLNDAVCDLATEKFKLYGVNVIRTDHNEGQTDESLSARVAEYLAKAAEILCVISVHHNALSATWSSATGIEVYTDNNPTAADTQLATLIHAKLAAKTGLRARGVKKAAFTVINQNKVTAVLCEGGFMDGTNDYKIITSKAGQQAYADAIVEAVVEMYNLKKVSSTTTSTTGKAYKVVKTINRYASAAAAQEKRDSKGTYEPGTYYIYNKYPDGLKGMYNISKDATGASAGSWINPSENVVEQAPTQPAVQQLYRVRKSWDDAKSQVGAFGSIDNAKDACQKAGSGYHVFDWNGKVVYSYTAPVTPKPEEPKEEPKVEPTPTPTPTAVYDLDYPVKTKIIEKGKTCADTEVVKAIKYIVANNPSFDIEIAKAFFKLAPNYGIDPTMAISQSILETGWFKYVGSAVKPEHHNYCGLGVTSTGITGGIFSTIEDGVTAQLQHLFAYGCKDALPVDEVILDPRFKYVTRGIAPYWQNLAGRWAVPGYDKNTYATPEAAMQAENTYGQKILSIRNKLLATTVSEADTEKYFPTPKEEPKVEPEVKPNDTTKPEVSEPAIDNTVKDPVENAPVTDANDKKADTIVDIILRVLKKLAELFLGKFNK